MFFIIKPKGSILVAEPKKTGKTNFMNKKTLMVFFGLLILLSNTSNASVSLEKSDFYAIAKAAEDLCHEFMPGEMHIKYMIQAATLEDQSHIDDLISNIKSAYGKGSCRYDVFTMFVKQISAFK